MTVGDRRDALNRIVEHTRAMRARVESNAWEEIVAMEAERQAMLAAFFAVEADKSEASWIARAIQDMLELNSQMEAMCRSQLEAVAKDLQQLNSGRRANDAYQSNSG